MLIDCIDTGYRAEIGHFDGVAYRDGEIGAIMSRTVTHPPGSISITTFWSKGDLEKERDLLQTDSSERSDRYTNETAISDTLTEINYALQRVEEISPDLIECMQVAVGEDLKQQYHDMGVRERFIAAIHPAKLRFSTNMQDYTNLQAVAEVIPEGDRDELTRSIVCNAIGHDNDPHVALGARSSPVYKGEAAQHHVAKNAFRRLAEVANPAIYEVSAPVAEV